MKHFVFWLVVLGGIATGWAMGPSIRAWWNEPERVAASENKYEPGRAHIWLSCSEDGFTYKRVAVTQGPQDMAALARRTPGCMVFRLEVGP